MPADLLREKLKALVEDLRPPLDPDEDKNDRYWLGWNDCLDEVAALLAESEPEPLPLGHPYYATIGGPCAKCGQPREAHE